MHFCFIATIGFKIFLKKILSGKSIKMGVHYVYPIKDLVGTDHVYHLFMVQDLYHHNDCIQIVMKS